MDKKTTLAAAALAALAMAGCKTMGREGHGAAAPAASTGDAGKKGECLGVNSCKGQGACGGVGHECAGNNECKGKGWLSLSEAECEGRHGTFKPG